MPISSIEQIVIVAAGVVVTLLLGWLLLFWIDQEWRKLDKQHFEGIRHSADQMTDSFDQLPPDRNSTGL